MKIFCRRKSLDRNPSVRYAPKILCNLRPQGSTEDKPQALPDPLPGKVTWQLELNQTLMTDRNGKVL
jgi:hypothetical protein